MFPRLHEQKTTSDLLKVQYENVPLQYTLLGKRHLSY